MEKIELPKDDYIRYEENGRTVVVCTLKQMCKHTIGLDEGHNRGRLYSRHGRKFFKPYRNYFSGNSKKLDKLVDAGYMETEEYIYNETKNKTYFFTRSGLDWLGDQLGIVIKDVED